MQRLLLVSNRLPVTIEKRKGTLHFRKSIGGVATGLSSFYEKYNSVWLGWCGLSSDNLDRKTKKDIQLTLHAQFRSHPTFLSRRDVRMFYSGFCNRTIWPLFHYFANHAIYDKEQWESYSRVNKLFCQEILKITKPDDIIWIHDYHLFLLPKMLKEKLPQSKIGFFLHIPFPSFEIFRLLPWRKEILEGMLGADLIGFHTYDYASHFISSIRRLLGYEHTFGQITVGHRIVKVDAFPMGIDFDQYAKAEIDTKWLNRIQNQFSSGKNCKIILSIDRLDYTKGIPQRLEAFDLFLERYPEYRKCVTLIMVAVPSRTGVETYRQLKQQVDELVGRINGKHGTIGWMPVWYLYRFLPFENIVALYNLADVALVTPLRDGMNLIAKEYVASKKDGRGVLVLSEMAGAFYELAEAIIVNPNNREEVAQSMKQALSMPEEERIERNATMKQRLQRYEVNTWAQDFMNSLSQITAVQQEVALKILTDKNKKDILKAYRKSAHRLLFLDYDGTLVPFAQKPGLARPDNHILQLLEELNQDEKNEVILISGRDKQTLENWFDHLNTALSAEHGVWIKERNGEWVMVKPLQSDWKKEVRPIFELYVDRTPGSFMEEKTFSLVWHYRNVDPELGSRRAWELKEALNNFTESYNLVISEGSKAIEIKNGEINKGIAGLLWTSKRTWDFILAIGDDWTDEDLFEALPDSAHSIKVGLGRTKAKYYLTDHKEVRDFLKTLNSK
ncbi:MAG: bifunctional alpha,alpha-trehalose-phosphate synthase (UDP-forming)/trehalose-phosphatase [bacterium]